MNGFYKYFVLSLVGVCFFACGEVPTPIAADQPSPQLQVPTPEAGFGLTGDDEDVTYSGRIVVWHEGVSPEALGRVAEATVSSRMIKDKVLATYSQSLIPALAEEKAARAALAQATAAKEADRDRKARNDTEMTKAMGSLVEEWFEGRLLELKEKGDIAADLAYPRAHFAAYCEAKIWELASSRLATFSYQMRPTPNQMCESYYREQGYFTGELCEAPKRGAKSFFQCLWQEGVLKSPLGGGTWQQLACDDNPTDHYATRGDAVRAWLAEDGGPSLLESILRDTEVASTFTGETYSQIFTDKVMLGEKFRTKIPRRSRAGERVYEDIERCKPAFSLREVRDGTQDAGWQTESPRVLLAIGESDGSVAIPYPLLPSGQDSELNAKNWALLAKFVGLFGRRQVLSGKNDGIAVSVSDGIFLKPAATKLVASKDDRCAVIGPDQKKRSQCEGDPAFESVRSYLARLVDPKLEKVEGEKKAALKEVEVRIEAIREVARRLQQEELPAALARGLAATSEEGVAQMLLGYTLKVVKTADKTSFSFQFAGGAQSLEGCLLDNGAPCAAEDDLGKLTLDATTGRLSFRIGGLTPETVGLHQPNQNGAMGATSGMSAATLEGSDMRFDLYPSQLAGGLMFLSGSVFVEREGRVLHEGSTSADAFGVQLPKIGI